MQQQPQQPWNTHRNIKNNIVTEVLHNFYRDVVRIGEDVIISMQAMVEMTKHACMHSSRYSWWWWWWWCWCWCWWWILTLPKDLYGLHACRKGTLSSHLVKFWHLRVYRSRGDGEDAIRWTGQESTPVERLLQILRHSMQLETSTEKQKLKEGC